MQRNAVTIEVSPGELIDKITILEIKKERISDAAKRQNIEAELAMLTTARDRHVRPSPELVSLTGRLRAANERLWQIEDELRVHESRRDFREPFVGLARSVYLTNDQRAAIKREINALLNSAFFEEKAYGSK